MLISKWEFGEDNVVLGGFQVAQWVKNPPEMQEMQKWAQSLG